MTILAETQQAAAGGGSAWFLPVMLVVMVLLLWLPMRRQKKAQAEMKAKQATMEPGTPVMTSFGLFGTPRDMDRENNRAVLEIAPGQLVTVHSQTVTTVVEETPEDSANTAGAADGSTAARHGEATLGTDATDGATPGTVSDTDERPEHETWRDARGDDERGTPTT